MKDYQLTIVIPVFNEQESLAKLHESLCEYLEATTLKSKVLFIDDGSTDDSRKMIKNICEQDQRFQFKSLLKNSGLSTALKAGFDSCNTTYTGYIDADLQTSPQDFMLYFDHLKDCNMVNGIRANRNDKFVKKISSKVANAFRRVMINDGIKDTCCPLKIMETSYAQSIPFFKGMHRFIPALVQLHGGKVKQIEVRHFPRFAGTAKYHLFNRLVGPFLDTLAFVWMKKRYITYAFDHQDAKLRDRHQQEVITK